MPVRPPHKSVKRIPRDSAARLLLNLLYRVHYIVGMKVQDTLRTNELLNRHQVAVLWIIRSEGIDGESVRRKYVEKELTGWYDISSSAISKAIRSLTSKELDLITIEEHPKSGREKLIKLTPGGIEFMRQMVRNGSAMCEWYLANMSRWDSEVDVCLYIYSKVNALFGKMIDREKIEAGGSVSMTSPQESVLHHPLTSSITESSCTWKNVPRIPREYSALMQLNIFFPIHYKAGNKLEQVLRESTGLSRQQVIILWLIAAEGGSKSTMPRKRIEVALKNWLEITSSSVSKAIRSLSARELGILRLNESRDSGREKTVALTAKGRKFVESMFETGVQYLEELVDHLSDEEVDMVIHIFSRTDEIFTNYPGPFRA